MCTGLVKVSPSPPVIDSNYARYNNWRDVKTNNRSIADISTECAMISFTLAKKILNKGKQAYDDEQVKAILKTLTIMAEQQIITEQYRKEKEI